MCVQRDALGLRGLLPPAERTLEQQLSRVREHLAAEKDDLCKNVYLQVSLLLFVCTIADYKDYIVGSAKPQRNIVFPFAL